MTILMAFSGLKDYNISFLWLLAWGHSSKTCVAQNRAIPASTLPIRIICGVERDSACIDGLVDIFTAPTSGTSLSRILQMRL